MTDKITVWGIGTTRTMRVHWLLREFGVTYETEAIGSRTGETQTDRFGRINPKRKIPVLVQGDLVLSESAAIITHLSDTLEAPADFYRPPDPAARARLIEWCFFVMTELDAHALYIIRRHDDLADIYGDAPVAVDSAKDYFALLLGAMAERLPDDGYLMGEKISIADILLMTCLEWAAVKGIVLPDRALGLADRLRRRPAYQTAYCHNYPDRQPNILPADN